MLITLVLHSNKCFTLLYLQTLTARYDYRYTTKDKNLTAAKRVHEDRKKSLTTKCLDEESCL